MLHCERDDALPNSTIPCSQAVLHSQLRRCVLNSTIPCSLSVALPPHYWISFSFQPQPLGFHVGHVCIQRHQAYKNYSRVHYRETCAFGYWRFESSISVSGRLHSVVYLGYTCENAVTRREWCEWMRRGRRGVLHGNRDEDACRDRSSFSSVQWFPFSGFVLFSFFTRLTHVTAHGV